MDQTADLPENRLRELVRCYNLTLEATLENSPLVPANWELPPGLKRRLGNGPGRQRVMERDGHVLVALHEVPEPRSRHRRSLLYWRTPGGQWTASRGGKGPHVFSSLLGSYAQTLETMNKRFDAADESYDYFELIGELSPVLRALRNMHTALSEARKLCGEDRTLLNARDEAYELVRSMELLMADAQSALDFDMARQAEAQSQTSHQMAVAAHRLNVLAALFFPLATLSSFFGANFSHGLENWDKAHPMWLMLAMLLTGLAAGLLLAGTITKSAELPRLKPIVKHTRR